MEIKKIRIGNDISLSVDLRQYLNDQDLKERCIYNPEVDNFYNRDSNPFVNKKYELYYPNQHFYPNGKPKHFRPEGSPVSIRNIEAILINVTRKDEIYRLRLEEANRKKCEDIRAEKERWRLHKEWEDKMREYRNDLRRHSRFIARFPIEPAMECFDPTPFDICCSGYPTYRAYPRHYLFAPYHGFGVHPRWSGIYKPICPMPPVPMMNPYPLYVPKDVEESIKDDSEYTAQVFSTDRQNIVEVRFPAKDQMHLGVYSMLLKVNVYVPGYTAENIKTITIDIPTIFEIVQTSAEDNSSTVRVDVNNIEDHMSTGEEIINRPKCCCHKVNWNEVYTGKNDFYNNPCCGHPCCNNCCSHDEGDNNEEEDNNELDVYVNEGTLEDNNIVLNRTDGSSVNIDISNLHSWEDGD